MAWFPSRTRDAMLFFRQRNRRPAGDPGGIKKPVSRDAYSLLHCTSLSTVRLVIMCQHHVIHITEGPRDALCQLKSCQLPRNSAETTCTKSPEQIEVMKLEGEGGPMCSKHVHSTVTRSSRFHCLIGAINKPKPTTVELCISLVGLYRRLPAAKFSKSTM